MNADTARPQQAATLAQHAAPRGRGDLVHQVVRDDKVERFVGKFCRRDVHLMKMHGGVERLGARVRIAQHATADVDRVNLGMGERFGVGHARRACRATHVENFLGFEMGKRSAMKRCT